MAKELYFQDEIVREKFNFKMFRRLLSYAGRFKKDTIKMIAVGLASALIALIPSFAMTFVVNYVLPSNGILPPSYLTYAALIIASLAVVTVTATAFGSLSTYISMRLGYRIIHAIRTDLFDHLMQLSFDYYDSHPSGKILVRVTNYTEEVAGIFIWHLTRIIYNSFVLALASAAAIVLDWRIGLIVIAAIIPFAVVLYFLAKALHNRANVDKSKNSSLTAFVAEDISGLDVIKAFNREKLNSDIQKELCDNHAKAFMRTTRIREIFFPMSNGVVNIVSSILVYLCALVIIDKGLGAALTMGAVIGINTCMQMLSDSVSDLCQRLETMTTLSTNLERIFDTLDSKPDITDKPGAKPIAITEGKVEFTDVTFSYDGKVNVLENLSLSCPPGSMTAIVGATGAGKTTLVSLLSRFYDLKSGRITVDGADVSEVTLDSLRSAVGVMMQDSFIFSGTVMDNIRFSAPEKSDEECIEAAKKVFAHDFIKRLPDGYYTKINEACSLSGGERQLLSFARLILSDPKILILDEATSHIDTHTEKLIQDSIAVLLKGRTSFVIAHRLSTIRKADNIVFIDDKNIVESGTHEQLMQLKGRYYRLLQKSADSDNA